VHLDEATLLWAAALVDETDPAELLAQVDVTVLAGIVARADAATAPVDAAARVLVEVVRTRPFPTGNAAIGWLAAVEVLAGARCRVAAGQDRVVALCADVRSGAAGATDVVAALRSWLVEEGIACPACGRRVYADEATGPRRAMPGASRFELTARCAFEHGRHDRSGRPLAPATRRPVERRLPVIAHGACGSFLVAGDRATVVVSPFCDDPPIVRVGEVDEVNAGDLVGRWDGLVERSSPLGFVPADAARPDEGGHVDLGRLRRALVGAGVGTGAV
jgi:hypothetical protein